MTMLQHWFFIPDLDGAYWTLNLELSFYLLMLLLYATKLLRNTYLIVFLLLISSWINVLFFSHSLIEGVMYWAPAFRRGYLFAAGILFYKAYKAQGLYSRMDAFLLALCLGTAWFGRDFIDYVDFAHVCLFFGVFWLFSKNKLRFIKIPVLIKLGGISYSLYVLHEMIGWEMLKGLKHFGVENFYLSRTIAIAAMLSLSYLVSTIVEKPAQKLINNNWKKLKPDLFPHAAQSDENESESPNRNVIEADEAKQVVI
jgi:peptidoglycan/LPS O-acetylase OafA/YrhL